MYILHYALAGFTISSLFHGISVIFLLELRTELNINKILIKQNVITCFWNIICMIGLHREAT